MNGVFISFVAVLFTVLSISTEATPVAAGGELNNNALMDYAYGYPAMDKRRAPGRPSLQDYLKLAALQFELDNEEAENEIAPNEDLIEPPGEIPINSDAHSVDKRRGWGSIFGAPLKRRRYGFWVSAINKMGNGGKRGIVHPLVGKRGTIHPFARTY